MVNIFEGLISLSCHVTQRSLGLEILQTNVVLWFTKVKSGTALKFSHLKDHFAKPVLI